MIPRQVVIRTWASPIKKSALVFLALCVFALGGFPAVGQTGAVTHATQGKKIKIVPMRPTDLSSGSQMYKEYCAVCHGTTGQGDGPAIGFMRTPPPDLRKLRLRNNGIYPAGYVEALLHSGGGNHGGDVLAMPAWESDLRSLHENVIFGDLRIYNLTVYVESLQDK